MGATCLVLIAALLAPPTGALAATKAGGGADANAGPWAARCRALSALRLPSLVVEEAQIVPAASVGPSLPASPGGVSGMAMPAHCLFVATLAPRVGVGGQHFGIGVQVRMPLDWNDRFLLQGGGGLDGILSPAYGAMPGTVPPPPLARGFAVASTDGGHRSHSMMDPRFALDQQARVDYAYNAIDQTTLIAKAVIAHFYARPPRRSYFVGCSDGGRDAMMVTERMPLAFDGVIAGDPTYDMTRINMDEAWIEQALARAAPKDAAGRPILSRVLSAADLGLVAHAVLEKCDRLDGLADGMINDYRACHFDPAALTCRSGKTPRCLTSAQVTALEAMMAGPHDSHGRGLYFRFPYDAGIGDPAFHGMHLGTSLNGALNSADATLGFDSLRYLSMTPPAPDFDPMKLDFNRDTGRLAESAALMDADSVYLETFAHHGKLILFHGLSDQGVSPLATVAWYERAQAANGAPIQSWARLFLIPGMTHCHGGPSTDDFDMLTAMVDWVEKGESPDRVIARGKSFPGVTRPLCPYPTYARYAGGNAKDARSFVCARQE